MRSFYLISTLILVFSIASGKVCPSGQFAIEERCQYCSQGCLECEGNADNCMKCKSNFKLENSNTCVSCKLHTFKRTDEEFCQDCPPLPNCSICIDENRCLECQQGFWLDLSTYQCKQTCSTTKVQIQFGNYKFCREPNFYIVDGNSTAPYEFGTQEFPFKRLAYASLELFNLRSSTGAEVDIFFPRGSNSIVHTTVQPIIFLAVSVRLVPWPALKENEDQLERNQMPLIETYSDISGVFEHESIYNPWKSEESMTYYNFEEKVKKGEVTKVEQLTINLKFSLIRSNVFIDNIRLEERLPDIDDYNWFFIFYYSPIVSFTLSRSYIQQSGSILSAYEGANINILNSHLFSSKIYYVYFLVSSETRCTGFKQQNFLVQNSTFEKHPYDDNKGSIFQLLGPGNFTITDNRFLNFQQKQDQGIIEGSSADNCFYEGNHSYTLTNNIWTGNVSEPATGSMYLRNTEYLDSPGSYSLLIQNNTFQDIRYESEWFFFDSIKPWRSFEISNNTFRNVDFYAQGSIFNADSMNSKLYFVNNLFENCYFDQLINFSAEQVIIENLSLINTKSYQLPVQAVIQFEKVKKLKLTNLQVKSSIISASLLSFLSIDQAKVERIQLHQSIFKSNIVILSDVRSISFENLEILNNSGSDEGVSLFDYQSIDAQVGSDIKFLAKDIKMSHSNFSFLQIQQIMVSEESKSIRIEFEDFEISDIKNNNKTPLIYLKDLYYEDLLVSFKNGKVKNIKMVAPFFIGNCNSQVSFDQLSIEFVEQNLFLFSPNSNNKLNPQRIEIMNSNFKNNFFGAKSGLIGKTNSIVNIRNSTFQNNFSLERGGVVFADSTDSQFYFKDSKFLNNYAALGGVSYSQDFSMVSFENCSFEQNAALRGGVAFIGTQGKSEFINCKLSQNKAFEASLFFQSNSQQKNLWKDLSLSSNIKATDLNGLDPRFLKVISSQMSRFQEVQNSQPIQVEKGNAIFYGNYTVVNQENLIIASSNSLIVVKQLKIENTTIDSLIQIITSRLEVSGMSLYEVKQSQGYQDYLIKVSSLSSLKSSDISILNVRENFLSVKNSKAIMEGFIISKIESSQNQLAYISVGNSNASIDNLQVENFKARNRFVLESLQNSLDLSFVNTVEVMVPFLFAKQTDLRITNSTFQKTSFQENDYNSLIQLENSNAEIKNCDFIELKNSKAISASQSFNSLNEYSLKVFDSQFAKLESDKGGAIATSNYNLQVTDSKFQKNKATQSGGALFLSCDRLFQPSCELSITNSEFTENEAAKDGGAVYFDFIPFSQKGNKFVDNKAGSGYGNNIASFPLELKIQANPQKVVSGKPLEEPFVIQVIDFHGQIVTTDNSSFIMASLNQASASITGISLAQANKGLASLQAFELKAQPNSVVTINFQQNFISSQDYFKITGRKYKDPAATFTLQECGVGDILRDNECVACPKGTYQLELGQTKCNFCPDNFSCAGGSSLSVKKSFWRSGLDKIEAYECLEAEACLGGESSACQKGYTGKLCAICSGEDLQTGDYYARSGRHACTKCAANSEIIGQLTGVLLLIMAYVAGMVSLIILSVSRKKQKQVLVRIMTNYFQIVLMVRNLEIHWPERVEKMLASISFVSSAQDNLLQLSCLFRGSGISPYLVSTVSIAFVPLILGLAAVLVWRGMAQCRPKALGETWLRNSVTTFFVIAYLSYPSITNAAFQGLNCLEIDGKKLLKSDLEIECYDSYHQQIIFFVILPIFLVWILGFPVVTFFLLKMNIENLNERRSLILYGLFYVGLRDETFYWEVIVNNGRKLFFSIISVSFDKSQTHQQLMLIFSYLYVNHQFIKKIQPYEDPIINSVDLKSSTAAISAILMGLMFLENAKAKTSLELEIVFWLLCFVNLVFIVSWCQIIINIYFKEVQAFVYKTQNKPLTSFQIASQNKSAFRNRNLQRMELERKKQEDYTSKLRQIQKQKVQHIPEQLAIEPMNEIFKQVITQKIIRKKKRGQFISQPLEKGQNESFFE